MKYSEGQHITKANVREERNNDIPFLSDLDSFHQKIVIETDPCTFNSNTHFTLFQDQVHLHKLSNKKANLNNTRHLYEIKIMMQNKLKRAVRDEFDTESDTNSVNSLKDELCKAVIEKINESDSSLPREGNQTFSAISLGNITFWFL